MIPALSYVYNPVNVTETPAKTHALPFDFCHTIVAGICGVELFDRPVVIFHITGPGASRLPEAHLLKKVVRVDHGHV